MTPQLPTSDYASFADVVQEVRDVYAVDLVRFCTRLVPKILDCLEPEPLGVYARGALEPLIAFTPTARYFTMTQYRINPAIPDIKSYHDFINSQDPIVDGSGNVICLPPSKMKHLFQETCGFHYSAIHLAVVSVWNLLNGLNKNTRPCCNLPLQWLNESHWVLPQHYPTFDIAEQHDVGFLLDGILAFIGRDYYALYSLKLQNTTLIIEKGNDYRVIEYYRPLFEAYESERFEKFGF